MAMPRPPARLSLSVLVLALFAVGAGFADAPVPPDHAEKMARGQEIFTQVRPRPADRQAASSATAARRRAAAST